MQVIIMEDEKTDQEILLGLLDHYTQDTGQVTFAHVYTAPEELPEDFSRFDAAILDIIIDGEPKGVDIARKLRSLGFSGGLIFTTMSEDYYPEGFEVDASHYLVKPLCYGEFSIAMKRMAIRVSTPPRMVTFPAGKSTFTIQEDSLLYAEVYGKETLLHTIHGQQTLRLPLKRVELQLGCPPFLRCFRSYIVNMNHIISIEGNVFILTDGSRIPISIRTYRQICGKYLEYRLEKI